MVNIKTATGNTVVAQRISRALEEERIKPAHLAARTGISRGYISKLLKGTKMNLSLEMAQKIGEVVQRDVAWLLGREPDGAAEDGRVVPQETMGRDVSQVAGSLLAHGASQPSNRAWRRFRLVPIVSFAQGGNAIDFDMLPLEDREVVPSTCSDPRAFALILRGESMEPFFSEGDVIIVSPAQEPRFERLAVAQLSGVGVCFKLLNLPPAKGRVKLSSYNPAFAPVERSEKEFDWIYPVHSVIKYENL